MLNVCLISRMFRQMVEKLFCAQLSALNSKKLNFILTIKGILKIWELRGKKYVKNLFFS